MTHTPEVTTALAIMAEKLSKHKTFKKMPCGFKRALLSAFAPVLFKRLDLKEDQKEEFTERFVDTILAPWCYLEYQNDAG